MNGYNTPLAENQYVQELFSVLKDNGRDATGLAALIGHVSEMESFVKRSEDRIAEMKSQLAEMKEAANHPVRTALQNTVRNLESKVAEIKEQIGELKASIIEGCKNAVAAFKEKGASALDKLASFFKIKDGLQGLQKSIDKAVSIDDKAIARIGAYAKEYHTAGQALKNMARIAVGKEPIDAKKEAGKLAKAIAAPYRADRAILLAMRKSAGKALAKLDQLETGVAARHAEREIAKKPSLLGELQKNIEAVEQMKREAPIQERAKTKGAEL